MGCMDETNDNMGPRGAGEPTEREGEGMRLPDGLDPLEHALHAARALVLADLAADGVARPEVVSMVEDSIAHRRWWVEQWPEGAAYVSGLVAQDVQDALLEQYGRWPLCPVCVGGEPHALDVEPELGPDPHWVCGKAGVVIAPVGALGPSEALS
jgi:hypothetical protein